jgi:hypothetical protein
MARRTETDEERRRTPRFNCGGNAKIACLPSSGIILLGAIRDLSLGGCCIDTALPIECGKRAELAVQVNGSSFRALAEVRTIRGRSEAGIEFVRLSAGGRDMLAELIEELARFQALSKKLKSARCEMDAGTFSRELAEIKWETSLRIGRPWVEMMSNSDSAGRSSERNLEYDVSPIVVTVELLD